MNKAWVTDFLMKSKQQGEKETTMSPFHDSIVLENLAIVK
ncbi:hypothetical protein CGSSp19BS75_00282 [Streptococcus pneumoniae SP19-BS75]|nr:hypothetical protein CGSSp19BS75_00282 [Streptococcus pneumoniae SP19-BS75]EHE31718.1 hypothetical protein SPAR94_2285 [Streptococcus pneumoniae GA47373]EHZ14300.1 hypothetical protein SPAR26_2238 [Streptococcus pneumoniae GA13224]KGI25316.1 hypothetical protein BM49_2207 [Streptococcus pneumoniae]KGI34445.1 hypothetical protein X231_1914 [Streptococcus pneumoniae ECC_3510]